MNELKRHAARVYFEANSRAANGNGSVMDWNEPVAKKTPAIAVGEPLATLSIADLEDRITALSAEIERVKAEIARKKAHEAAASALFKS
jgi:uncharacterized small protein (DUF1192 family)